MFPCVTRSCHLLATAISSGSLSAALPWDPAGRAWRAPAGSEACGLFEAAPRAGPGPQRVRAGVGHAAPARAASRMGRRRCGVRAAWTSAGVLPACVGLAAWQDVNEHAACMRPVSRRPGKGPMRHRRPQHGRAACMGSAAAAGAVAWLGWGSTADFWEGSHPWTPSILACSRPPAPAHVHAPRAGTACESRR